MPPTSLLAPTRAILSSQSSVASLLKPFAQLQVRSASILGSLSDVSSSYNKRIRVGRGPSSGKGKTSGRGQKGQKARGKAPKQFNGGQTPEGVTHGKQGFANVNRVQLQEVNLDKIQTWIDQGRLDPSRPITLKELTQAKVIRVPPGYDGVKLLASHAEVLKTPVHLVVSRASQSAISAVEAVGGTVTTRFYTPQAVSRIKSNVMHPYISQRWDPEAIGNKALLPIKGYGMSLQDRVTGLGFQYRLPDPVGRKDLEYYRDARNRGYLSHTVANGENASLFWGTMSSEADLAQSRKGDKSPEERRKEANSLW